jgi:hypothetical protein
VQVASGGLSAAADAGDLLTAGHLVANLDEHPGVVHVQVAGGDAAAVVDRDDAVSAAVEAAERHDTD